MSATNNAVAIMAGLVNNVAVPSVGVGSVSQSFAFTEGYRAMESYIEVVDTATALNTDFAADYGYLLIVNLGIYDVLLKVGTTSLGHLPAAVTAGSAGGIALIPCGNTAVINATTPASPNVCQVYVAAIRLTANS
jgi:hypothetical protein